MIGGVGLPELLIVGGACLLIFGPNRLPKLGKTIGQTLSSFKDGVLGKDEPDGDTPPHSEDGRARGQRAQKAGNGPAGHDVADGTEVVRVGPSTPEDGSRAR